MIWPQSGPSFPEIIGLVAALNRSAVDVEARGMATTVSKCGAPEPAATHQAAQTGTDKRREPRFECRKIIEILPARELQDCCFRNVMLSDCSRTGMRFVAAEPLAENDQFFAKVSVDGNARLLIYTVRHCSRFADGAYTIGAEFTGYHAAALAEDAQKILDSLLAR